MSQAEVERYERFKKLLNSKSVNALPDKGKRLNAQIAELEKKIKAKKQGISSPNSNSDSNSSPKSLNESSSQNDEDSTHSSANNHDVTGESLPEINDSREDEDEEIRKDLKHKKGFKVAADTRNYRDVVQDDEDDEEDDEEESEEEDDDDDDEDDEEEQSEDEEEDHDSFDNTKRKDNHKQTYKNVRKLESDDEEEEDQDDGDVVTVDTKSARNTVTVSDDEDDDDDEEEEEDDDDDEEGDNDETENDESDVEEFKYKTNKKRNVIDSINESNNVSNVLDIDKLNSVSTNAKEKNAFVSDKLKHLGLNDTNENESFEIDTRGTKKKSLKNIGQDDSIEWLNESNSTKPLKHKKLLGYLLSETPDTEEKNAKQDVNIAKKPFDKTALNINLAETPDQGNNDTSSLPNIKENENSQISAAVINDSIVSVNESLPYIDNDKQQQSQNDSDTHEHDESSVNQKKFTKKMVESDESDAIQIIESPIVTKKSLNDSVTYKKIPKEERQVASWSPNYEKLKAKLEKLERPSPRKTKLLDELPSSIPGQNEIAKKFNLTGGISAYNQRTYMKNLGSEEELKQLSAKIMKIVDTKPRSDDIDSVEPPKGLKVKLLDHQYYGLKWLQWREETFPRGGILADDMGLGKTLTTLCHLLLIKERRESRIKAARDGDDDEEQEEDDDDDDIGYKKKGAHSLSNFKVKRLKTLVIVPASLLHQWTGEIENRFTKGAFKYYVYHEANRKKYSYNLEDNDIVFTTYEIATRELTALIEEGGRTDSPLAQIKWKRLILDEAHRIKNHTTKANKVICAIRAKYRIAITGTPIQNSLNDFYSLIKFLHLSPLDDFGLWKYISAIDSKNKEIKNMSRAASNTQGVSEREIRLNSWLLLLSDLLVLRRTKADIVEVNGVKRSLVELPEKKFEEVRIRLSSKEQSIYNTIFNESKDRFKKLLSKKITNMSEILVYLLRLRQACCHLSLLSECLDLSEIQTIKMESEGLDELVKKMDINKSESSISDVSVDLSNVEDCLKKSFLSSKLKKLLDFLEEIIEDNPEDKLIIVSQWTSMLTIIAYHLKRMDLEYCEIRGDVNLMKRHEIVKKFNDPRELDARVMLLSLNAGGVGLNLIGANRMFLLDIHWNPALEQQAADRIYRVGQKKNVFIYKFLCDHTIEERIQQIQQYKISIADKVCNAGAATSASSNSKLSLRDLKLLFTDFE